MSTKSPPRLVPGKGWRVDDAKAIFSAFNMAATMIGSSSESAFTIARRLRLLSAWASMGADHMDERDTEADGMAVCDAFWIRNGIDPRVRFDGPTRGDDHGR